MKELNMKEHGLATMAALWILPFIASPAIAQNARPTPAEEAEAPTDASEIVVTGARARLESRQEVPLSVAVVGGRQIESLHAKNVADLASLAPNLTITPMGSTAGSAAISIRGFSAASSDPAAEPGVAVYIDGVYQVINKGSLTDLYDIERVEVLNGPQSALLGRSASAGALLITHTRPTGKLEGKGQLEYGSHNLVQINTLLNVPIVEDKLAAKFYVSYRRRDGYFKNLAFPGTTASGEDFGSVRGALLFTPTDRLEIYLTGDYKWDRSQQAGARNVSPQGYLVCGTFGFCDPDAGTTKVTHANEREHVRSDENNLTGNVKWQPGRIAVTSITGYKWQKYYNPSDLDATQLTLLHANQHYDVTQFSQEIRITPQQGDGLDLNGRLSWVVGGWYGNSSAGNHFQTYSGQATIPNSQAQVTHRDGYAFFGQFDIDLIKNLTLSFGARRSHSKTTHDYNFAVRSQTIPPLNLTQNAAFNNTSFEGGARYNFSPSKMIYFRYAQGYREGGFNGAPGNAAAAIGFGPETSKGYEVGAKTTWLDGALLFNVALFDVKFKGLQRVVTVVLPSGFVGTVTQNAANADTKGIEIQSVLKPVEGFTFRANFGYLDAKYVKYTSLNPATGATVDLSGQPLTFAPKYTAMGAVDYQTNLGTNGVLGFDTIDAHAIVNWRSSFEMSNSLLPVGHQPGYATTDLSIDFAHEGKTGYSLGFYVKNVFNKYYQDWATAVAGFVEARYDNIGRTFGVTLSTKF